MRKSARGRDRSSHRRWTLAVVAERSRRPDVLLDTLSSTGKEHRSSYSCPFGWTRRGRTVEAIGHVHLSRCRWISEGQPRPEPAVASDPCLHVSSSEDVGTPWTD